MADTYRQGGAGEWTDEGCQVPKTWTNATTFPKDKKKYIYIIFFNIYIISFFNFL